MRPFLTAALALATLSAHAQSLDPGDILNQMGAPWIEAKAVLPPPDSGQVVGKTGDLLWERPDDEVAEMRLAVREGVLTRLVVSTSEEGRGEFDEVSTLFRERLGEPGPDGFYSSDQLQRMGAPSDPAIEMSLDAQAGVMVVRLAER